MSTIQENPLNPYLPPIGAISEDGESHAGAWAFLSLLARESRDAADVWIAATDANYTMYVEGDSNYDDPNRVIINEIQNAIIAATDIQTKDPPSVTLDPVETGEPSTYFFSGKPEIAAMFGIPPEFATPTQGMDGSIVPPPPLPEALGKALCEQSKAGLIPDDVVVELNDKLVTDTFQTVFDVFWARAGIDRRLRQYLLTTNIGGFAWQLFEWDHEQKQIVLKPMSVKQVYIDPTVEDIADAAYVGVDLIIDAEEAKKLYPHLQDEIEKSAVDGQPYRPDGYDIGSAFQRTFRRKMVTLRTFWLRNQPALMDEQQAMESGHVQAVDVPTGEMAPVADPMGNVAVDAIGQPMFEPVTRQMLANAEGEEVDPSHPDWPTYRALRQITCVQSAVVDDRVCPHWDIPILHNVNIPIPQQPWGIGEPYRLRRIQEARNKQMTAIVNHTDYYRAPTGIVSQAMYNALPEEIKSFGIRPGTLIIVPDALYQQMGGKVVVNQDPPEMPQSLVTAQGILKEELTELSGHTEVMQGRANSQMSGRAIETLQTAATSLIGFKSQRTGDVCYRLARLMLHCLVNYLEIEDLNRIISRYPIHILQAIQDRARAFEWDVTVTVSSGSGALKAQRKMESLQDLQVGAISKETYREKAGIDHQQEERRLRQEMMALPMAMPGQEPNGQQQPPAAMNGA